MNLRKKTAELLEQEHYNDRLSRSLNMALVILILLNLVAIILETVNPIYQQYQRAFWYFEIFSVVIFTIEYLARLWSCIDLTEADQRTPTSSRIKYMLSPIALIDLLAILPFYLSLYMAIDLRFLRGLRMLRILKLTRYSPALGVLLEVIKKESHALLAIFLLLVIMLITSAGGIYLLEKEYQPEVFGSVPEAMWWAIITLTTVGYGDVVPVTAMGKVFAGFIGIIGICMLALPAAIMASGFAQNFHGRREKYNHYIQKIIADGIIDENERWKLEEMRKELGLDSDEGLQILDSMLRQARQNQLKTCPHCNKALHEENSKK